MRRSTSAVTTKKPPKQINRAKTAQQTRRN
jgi:hypothetical protein